MNTATLVYDLQRESIRARSGTGIVSLLAIVSLTIGSAIAFLVAGGTWMFWERAQHVEDAVRATGSPEVPSHEVGLAILGPLRELDEVAYLRFASVYRSFSSIEDFEKEIRGLRDIRPEHTERGCSPDGASSA